MGVLTGIALSCKQTRERARENRLQAMAQYRASKPEGVTEKLAECRFFLARMEDYERERNIESFLYCLSAFLSAFRATIYRTTGVVCAIHGERARQNLRSKFKSSHNIWFLKDATDLEVHGDGPRMWQVNLTNRFTSRWDRSQRSRLIGRFKSSPGPVPGSSYIQFEDYPTSVLKLCRISVDELETMAKGALNTTGEHAP